MELQKQKISNGVKAVFATWIISSFMAVVVFGFTAFGCEGTGCIKPNEHRFCLASAINPASCPDDENAFVIAAFHLNALKNILITTLEAAGAAALLNLLAVILTIFIAAAVILQKPEAQPAFISQNWRKTGLEEFITIRQKFRQWLARHEKRDPNSAYFCSPRPVSA